MLSFKGEPTMTMHYCDITNLSGSDRSGEHSLPPPTAVQITCNWPITLSPGLPGWALGGAGAGDPSHLVWVAQVCRPWRDCSPLLLKGCPVGKAVDHRTSHRVRILLLGSGGRAAFDHHRWEHFKMAFPTSASQSHSSFTSLLELSVSADFTFSSNYNFKLLGVSDVTWT